MIKIYSAEQIDRFYPITSNFANGTIIKSIAFRRNNYLTTIYVNFTMDKSSFPYSKTRAKCYRGYYDDNGQLQYDVNNSSILTESGQILFNYISQYERNYINYYVTFECIGDLNSLSIDEMGLILQEDVTNKGILSTRDRVISFGSSNNRDINQNFTSFQTYNKFVQFTFETNRNNLDRVVNILSYPFKLVDIKNECINNSSRLLALLEPPKIDYSGTSTQYISITVNCLEEI